MVDEKGPAFGGVLAFRPTQYEVGRRPDGFLVAGFGGLYSEAAGTIPPPPEPAVVFLNGRVIYEHDDVAAFGIAADGSSFYAVETHSAESFSLLVRNLDEGREYRYDIGDLFKAWGLEFCYGARYSLDYSEVHLIPGCPGNDVGMGTHYFYKTGSLDAPAKITVEARERREDAALLVSSEEGYFVYDESAEQDRPNFRVVRRQFGWPESKTKDVWSFVTPHNINTWSMRVSGDGVWLILKTTPSGLP